MKPTNESAFRNETEEIVLLPNLRQAALKTAAEEGISLTEFINIAVAARIAWINVRKPGPPDVVVPWPVYTARGTIAR